MAELYDSADSPFYPIVLVQPHSTSLAPLPKGRGAAAAGRTAIARRMLKWCTTEWAPLYWSAQAPLTHSFPVLHPFDAMTPLADLRAHWGTTNVGITFLREAAEVKAAWLDAAKSLDLVLTGWVDMAVLLAVGGWV